jgi:Sulfotransferase family
VPAHGPVRTQETLDPGLENTHGASRLANPGRHRDADRITGMSPFIAYRIHLPNKAITAMKIGYVDSFASHKIVGWAADADQPDVRHEVTVLVDGTPRGVVLADRPREGLRQLGTYGDGAHGFEYSFDPPLSLLRSYDVVVRFSNDDTLLRQGRFRIERERPQTIGMQPLLVTATGRSGTTLLMRRLGNDPHIAIADAYPFEMKLLTYYAHALEILTSPGNREKTKPLDAMVADSYHLGLNPFHHPVMEPIYPKPAMLYEFFGRRTAERLTPALRDTITDFYRDMCIHQGKTSARFFAEKCDVFTPARSFARLAFGNLKEILLVRDPRDVHCSRKSFWADTPEASFQNLRAVQSAMLAIWKESAGEVLAVKYEDLILQPDEAMARISGFLELDKTIQVKPESEQKVFSGHGTSQDPTSSIGRWKQEMSAEERASFDKEFQPFLETFGYQLGAA